MYYLSMAAMFRQENRWLKEWLDYHIARGVEDERPIIFADIEFLLLHEVRLPSLSPLYMEGQAGSNV